MNLYEKHRPTDILEIVGNEQLIRDLRPYLSGKREMPAAILFSGPSGCGKTTLAKILAKATGAHEVDIKEMDTADFRGIDSIRAIRQQVAYAPIQGTSRFWILDECHMLTNEAQNALLKALESPPNHAHFILCTTDPQKLLKTILTRCVQFTVERLGLDELVQTLVRVCELEEKECPLDVLEMVAEKADGSARAALTMLETLLTRNPKDRTKDLANFVTVETQVKELCQALLQRKKWVTVSKLLKALNEQPETVRLMCLGYMNTVLLSGRETTQAALIIECFKDNFYNSGKAGLTLACYYAILEE